MISPTQETWGPRALTLDLPATRVQFTGLSSAQITSLETNYAAFLLGASQGSVKHDLVCHTHQLAAAPTVSTQEKEPNGLYTYVPQINRGSGSVQITGSNFVGSITTSPSSSSAYLGVTEEDELANASVIENFLRFCSANKVLERQGVMLHSAGLVFDGQAYIFTGRSGAGKTTLTRKAYAKGAWVLSDDINVLLPSEEGYQAYAVPFTGEFGRTLNHKGGRNSYPVAGIILLSQGDTLKTERVRQSQAFATLLAGCPFVNTDAVASTPLYDAISNVLSITPVIRLINHKHDSIGAIMDAVKKCVKDESKQTKQ